MNDTTNTYSCKQCRESVKHGAKICPHCHSEQYLDPCKICRKKLKRGAKKIIACVTLPAAMILFVSGIWGYAVEKESPDDWLILFRHCFFALVCLHFFTFHIVYDEDEKKGGDDGGGGGGGGE